MKKIINKISITGLFLLVATFISAQNNSLQKTDKVIFLNGVVKEGKVIAFANEKVRFVHYGETLNYEWNKNEIEKIEYSSGRTEVITEKRAPEVSMFPVNSRNRVAVLPMTYIGDGSDDRSDEMSFQLQEIAVSYLSGSASALRFVDVAELNAQLYRNGINDETIRRYTPKELAAILHVEYIIMGSVMQDKGNIVTINNNYTTRRQTVEQWGRHDHRDYHNHRGNQVRVVNRSYRNNTSVTRQNIETQVSLSIYSETGDKIYTKSRRSILSEQDAYRNAIHYLLKRTPLYNR